MDLTVLSTLMSETTIPHGVTFNACGVAQKGLRYTFEFRKLRVEFRVIAINGAWGGNVMVMTPLWGFAGPVTRRDCSFASFEDCVAYLWQWTHDYIERNKENVSMEFLHFKVAERQWTSRSSEEKFAWFNSEHYYGEEI